ncbi:hypothetical protein GG681_16875 [Epibacterium sp. SM1969]|uniref:Uncharacterized protein n=1 Tax=Tritonibacter aquimaris TaxID=2663379 RepID=A0A844B2L2_9RHOB|nr:hypothetical protein [Tritonibacter aquimaris]MQY44321.1 hypothetical protein [Tritonibacter aquimaris]
MDWDDTMEREENNDNRYALVLEKPDGIVKRKASFYPMMGSTLTGHLSYTPKRELRNFPPFKDRSWSLANEDRFPSVDLPDEMKERWVHKRLDVDPSMIEAFTADLTINNDDLIPHIPDISGWFPFLIISARAKDILGDIYAGGSYFIPLTIYSQNGSEIDGEYYWWVVRDRIAYLGFDVKLPVLGVPFPGPFSDSRMVYEMVNNVAVKNYLKRIPYWGAVGNFQRACFETLTFEKLKTSYLSGLVENTEENFPADRKIYESIGHIE